MSTSHVVGLYYLPEKQGTTPFASILSTIQSKYRFTPIDPWGLRHRLLREIAVVSESQQLSTTQQPTKYLHVLRLGHHPGKSFLSTSQPTTTTQQGSDKKPPTSAQTPDSELLSGGPITIPIAQEDAFSDIITTRLNALWQPRATLLVGNGISIDIGPCMLRMGELRSLEGSGQAGPVRGLVMCLSVKGDVELSYGEGGEEVPIEVRKEVEERERGVIRDAVKELGLQWEKEMFTSGERQAGDEQGHFDEVRIWCEVLRMRG